MAEGKNHLVKFLCVDVKSGETQEKLKAKVLRAIHNSEKKSSSMITHPLQAWTDNSHTFKELRADQVTRVVANSSHVTFLLSNGRVCRLRVKSWEESSGSKTLSLDALRQPQQRSSFQVLGDEEYARQLQAELNSDLRLWSRGDYRRQSLQLGGFAASNLLQGIEMPNVSPYVMVDDNPRTTPWLNAQASLLSPVRSSLVDDLNLASHTSIRRGMVRADRTKLSRVWPEMGGLEWLIMKQNPEDPHPDTSFVAIAAMHSEILLVSSKSRQLYSWACTSDPSPKPHPLSEELGLTGERVSLVEASDIRATVVTESGKIASFYDSLLRSTPSTTLPSLVQTLTHKAQVFPELDGEQVAHVTVSNFLTCAVTASGKVFWWGLCPPTKPASPNAPHPAPSSSSPSSSSRGAITDGCLVRLRNGPPCGPNSMVFNTSGHNPRVGKTMNIIEHSGLDPKTSILVKVYKDMCHMPPAEGRVPKSKLLQELDGDGYYDGLEVWSLPDVVFLDDSPAVLGRVVTVDQLQAIVDISCASSESGTMGSTSGAQSTLKVFKLTDIEPCIDKRLSLTVAASTGLPSAKKGEGLKVPKVACDVPDSAERVTVTQHIAGIVQHRPACLLTPDPKPQALNVQPHPPRGDQETPANPPCTCIYGFYPLAVQMTDNGPIMLVKRVLDEAAFLVCSGHPSFPSFSSTSFVSLKTHEAAKPGRATINEESVLACNGGFDRENWACCNAEMKGLNSAARVVGENGLKSLTSRHPSFLQLHKSDAIFLQDSNGVICSLSEGLRLSPAPLLGQRGKKVGPVQPYKCIASRFHAVKKNSSTLIVVVVPEPQRLMPVVMCGDSNKVDSLLKKLTKTLSSKSGKTPQPAETSEKLPLASEPPAKKFKPLEPEPEQSGEGESEDSEFCTLSTDDLTKIDFGAELTVLTCNEVDVAGGCGLEVLREKTDQNCNILHVCGKLDHTHSSKGKGGGSVLGSKSASSCPGGGSTVSPDKSFEEMRFEHFHETVTGSSPALEGAEEGCLPMRLLWILGRFLDCEPIRSAMIDLLCSCNREGHTPFLSAICSQNYAAALKILEFVEKISCPSLPPDPSHPSPPDPSLPSPLHSSLFDRAILKPALQGVSTLHLLLGSLSSTFDLKSMALYVHNLQLSTAKQLLRLFQVRYPSAFKAEILSKGSLKDGSEASSSSSGGDSDSEQAAVQELESVVLPHSRHTLHRDRVRRSYRNIPRRRIARSHDNIVPMAKYGVVYFSDVTELRAAAQEMHGFRIVSSMSRNTGFGATQTISYLSVSREEPPDSPEDGDGYPYLADGGGPSSHIPSGPIMYEFMDSLRGATAGANTRGGVAKKKAPPHVLSSPDLLCQLLHRLLSYPSLVTSLDPAGETAMASLVHNPRCIDKLTSLSSSSSAAAATQPQIPPTTVTKPAHVPPHTVLVSMPSGRIEGEATLHWGSASMSSSGTSFHRSSILPYVSLDDHVEPLSRDSISPPASHTLGLRSSSASVFLPTETNSSSHLPSTDHAPFQEMDCAPSPTRFPSSSMESFVSHFLDTEVGGASAQDRALLQTAKARNVVGNILDTVVQELEEKVMQKDRNILERINSQLTANQGEADGDCSEAWLVPTTIFKPVDAGTSGLLGKRTSSASLFATGNSSVGAEMASLTPSEPLKEPLLFGTGSSSPQVFDTASSISDMNFDPPCMPAKSASPSGEGGSSEGNGFSIVQTLFSNWPSILTSVLGFNMTSLLTSDHTHSPPTFSSVHLLDSFTTDLLLNCPDHVIDCFVDTIVQKLNSAMEAAEHDEVDSSLFVQDIDYADPDTVTRFAKMGGVGVAVLVGRRFLSSVVRILALEHSRVKNRFLEMQQQTRQEEQDIMTGFDPLAATPPRRAPSNTANSPQTSKKASITPTIISILSRFSWLSVHALAQAAEACASPVRLGVSKPLGASSVIPDYQGSGRGHMGVHHYASMNSSMRQVNRQNHTLTRQLHVRAARMNSSALSRASSLPSEGIFLQPQLDGETGSTRVSGLNPPITESSEDEELHVAQPMDGVPENQAADEDPAAMTVGHSRMTTPPAPPMFPIDPTSPPYSTQIHNGVFLDLNSTSSSDGEGYHLHGNEYLSDWVDTGAGGGGHEDDNLDSVYMFAWALDGRRIGENGAGPTGRAESPNSITGPFMFNSSHEITVPLANIPSIRFGAGFLARTFARFVKDLVDISLTLSDAQQQSQVSIQLPPHVRHQLVTNTVHTLEQTWVWAVCVLDMAEGQLQQGHNFDVQRHVVSLRGGNGPNFSGEHRRASHARASRSFIGSTPGEYVASLLRSRNHEGRDCLPVLDLYGYEHVVYVLDGLLYTLTHWPKHLLSVPTRSDQSLLSRDDSPLSLDSSPDGTKKIKMDPNDKSDSKTDSKFFRRTDSVVVSNEKESTIRISNVRFFGVDGGANLALESPELVGPPNQWGKRVESFSRPLHEEYPLASRPHLLKPFAKKEVLFGGSGKGGAETGSCGGVGPGKKDPSATGSSDPSRPEAKNSFDDEDSSSRAHEDGPHHKEGKRARKRKHMSHSDENGPLTMMWSVDHAQQRWHSAISVFAHIFLAEGPGNERANFLNAHAGFASRMARFRHQVSQLFDAAQSSRDWAGTVTSTLSIRVRRDRLMQDSLNTLQQLSQFHYSNVRVKFDGEDGSGPGVNRGFFASLSNDLKSSDISKNPLNRLGLFFHEPGKQPEQSGLFAPHPFMPHTISNPSRTSSVKNQRRDAFVAIGRFFGLCLWFRYTIPFMVCRHVAKMLLGRPLAWHDLAFYNADLYEGLRQMMLDAEQGKKDDDEFMATYCSYFEAPLPGKFVEPVLVELVPGGSKVPVSLMRVQEYVRLYSMFMMVGCVQEELAAMKQGLNDIIPNDLLSGLTAEDFQLLLSGGSADITLARLKSIIRFNHTHGSSRTICDRFEKMFWRIVSHMTNTQRQQLLYFATGSAALPASVDSTSRVPSVAITLDVIGSRSTDSLPVASTCSQRMCIPLYPSYHILKKKLLQAIQCQAYGLG